MADWGFKISKTNKEAGTAVVQDLIMTSTYPTYKTGFAGTTSMSKGTGVSYITGQIAHGLGYVPTCFVSGTYMKPDETGISTRKSYWCRSHPWGVMTLDRHRYYADSTNLNIIYETSYYSASAITFNLTYHIFFDED